MPSVAPGLCYSVGGTYVVGWPPPCEVGPLGPTLLLAGVWARDTAGKVAGPQKRWLGSALASSSLSGLVLTDPCGLCGTSATTEVFIFLWKIEQNMLPSSMAYGNHSVDTFAFLTVSLPFAVTRYLFPYRQIIVVALLSNVQLCDPVSCKFGRLPCPSLSPGVCLNSCPLSQWCHPTISSSAAVFFSSFSLSQHQGLFQWLSSLHQWPNY